MPADEMTCRELVELVTDYLENAPPLLVRHRFEEHLNECGGCRAYIEQMRITIRAARATGGFREEAIEPEAQEALLRIFRDWRNAEP